MKKNTVILGLILTLCLTVIPLVSAAQPTQSPAVEQRYEPNAGLVILDLLLVRPLSAGVATVSTAFCIATSPLTFVIGIPQDSARVLVEAPWRFTAGRPLGDFAHYRDGRPITVLTGN